jgi:hypothetical protein
MLRLNCDVSTLLITLYLTDKKIIKSQVCFKEINEMLNCGFLFLVLRDLVTTFKDIS